MRFRDNINHWEMNNAVYNINVNIGRKRVNIRIFEIPIDVVNDDRNNWTIARKYRLLYSELYSRVSEPFSFF